MMMTTTARTFFNPQFLHTHIFWNNNTWTLTTKISYTSGSVKSQFPIHRSEFLHQIHFSHLAPICATLRGPKGFGPSPKQKKKTKKLRKDYGEEDNEEEEEEAEDQGVIPEVVTNRMISRMGFSVGIPLDLGSPVEARPSSTASHAPQTHGPSIAEVGPSSTPSQAPKTRGASSVCRAPQTRGASSVCRAPQTRGSSSRA